MTTIFSSRHRAPGLAALAAAGLVLGACAGPVTGDPILYAENVSPRVTSDAVRPHHSARSFDSQACVPDTQSFAEDCGGFVRYDGP